jgi:DNA-binding LytR/AlgR family response regulator
VSLIALLAAAISIAIAAYAAHRFAPDWRRRLSWGMAALAAASLLLIPWYDLKALAPIMAGFAAAFACSVRGMRSAVPAARLGAAAAATAIVLMVWQATSFLDQAYYLALAAFLIALVAEQVFVLRHARRTGAEEAERADGLEHRLREAGGRSPATVPLKDGARTHLVPESEILFCKAADDYSEVHLSSGRTILVTTTLSKLQQVLPDRFARVHKSYIVNKAHVTAVSPRPGGGRMLALAGGPSVPVGRSYAAALADQVQPPLPTRA